MRAKSIVLIVIALGCGLVASIGISQVMDKKSDNGSRVEMVKIYLAASDININQPLQASDVVLEEWPKDRVPEGAIRKLEDIEGKYAITRMYQGEVITSRKVLDDRIGVTDDIPEGYRVVSLKVRMDTAVSNLIKPGDKVDIIATIRKGRDFAMGGTKNIMQDVRIFAVNTETENEVGANGEHISAKTVSVLVQNEQVEPLMLAAEFASLRLSLRRWDEAPAERRDRPMVNLRDLSDGDTMSGTDEPTTDQPSTGIGQQMLSFLNNAQPVVESTPESVEYQFEMVVLTADGNKTYGWSDEGKLPVEVGTAPTFVPPMPAQPQPGAVSVTPGTNGAGQEPVEPLSAPDDDTNQYNDNPLGFDD